MLCPVVHLATAMTMVSLHALAHWLPNVLVDSTVVQIKGTLSRERGHPVRRIKRLNSAHIVGDPRWWA